MSSTRDWLAIFPNELMRCVHQHLSPHQLLLLEIAMTPDPSWRHVSDEELELARAAQEEFEMFDDSYYDDLYDGDSDDLYDGYNDGKWEGDSERIDDHDYLYDACDRFDVWDCDVTG